MGKVTKVAISVSVLLITLAAGGMIVNNSIKAEGYQLSEVQPSMFAHGKFLNPATFAQPGLLKTLQIAKRYFTEPGVDKTPATALPVYKLSRADLEALPDEGMHFVKLGHSSVLLKVQGEYWLLDPVFAERASPFSFLGPKRFHQTPISLEELPFISKVLISHNHYDHLDKQSIKQLTDKTAQFLVPLGVERDLQKWGVPSEKIVSFDWWQEQQAPNALIAFTPTQHFSGRGIGDGNSTLWGSWVIKTSDSSVYFSGDSGYFDGFRQIGERYGPFDLTFIETGAYDHDWKHIHMTPEQSVQAHMDVKGKVMVPVHNGTFDLAFHAWYEPLERVSEAALQVQAKLLTPQVGQPLALEQLQQHVAANVQWWKALMTSATAVRQDNAMLLAE